MFVVAAEAEYSVLRVMVEVITRFRISLYIKQAHLQAGSDSGHPWYLKAQISRPMDYSQTPMIIPTIPNDNTETTTFRTSVHIHPNLFNDIAQRLQSDTEL